MNIFNLTLVFFAYFHMVNSSFTSCAGKVCVPNDYDKFEMPKNHVQVGVDIEIIEILEINDRDFTVSFYMYFSVAWNDPRLMNNASDRTVSIETIFLNQLWVPDIYIYNVKSFYNSRVIREFSG